MDESFLSLEDTTPRTILRHQLVVQEPMDTPAPIQTRSQVQRRVTAAKRKSGGIGEKVTKRAKGEDGKELPARVLRHRSRQSQKLSTSALNESLNISRIKGVDQTYANLTTLDSGESSINESTDLETAARFRKKMQKPMRNLIQSEISISKLVTKHPESRKTHQQTKTSSESINMSANRAKTEVSLPAEKTYATINRSMMESSSDSIDFEPVKSMRHRQKRGAIETQMELNNSSTASKVSEREPQTEESVLVDKTYATLSTTTLESSTESFIDLGAAKSMRNRPKTQGIVLPDVDPALYANKLSQNNSQTWPALGDTLKDAAPSELQSSQNDSVQKQEKSSNLQDTVRTNDSVSESTNDSVSESDKTYAFSNNEESFENIQDVAKQRFSRKTPAIKLDLSTVVGGFTLKPCSVVVSDVSKSEHKNIPEKPLLSHATNENPHEYETALETEGAAFTDTDADVDKTGSQMSTTFSRENSSKGEAASGKQELSITLLEKSTREEEPGGIHSSSNPVMVLSNEPLLPPVSFRDVEKDDAASQSPFALSTSFSSDSGEDPELGSDISAALSALTDDAVEREVESPNRELQLTSLNTSRINHSTLSSKSPDDKTASRSFKSVNREESDGSTDALLQVRKSPRKSPGNMVTLSPLRESPRKSLTNKVSLSNLRKSPRKSVGMENTSLSPGKDPREDQGGEASLSPSKKSPKKSLGKEVSLSLSKKSLRKSLGGEGSSSPSENDPREDQGGEASLSPSKKSPRQTLRREVSLSPSEESPKTLGREVLLSPSKKSPKSLGREVLLSPSKKSPREDRGRETSLSPSNESPKKKYPREMIGREASMSPSKKSLRREVSLSPSKKSLRKSLGGEGSSSPSEKNPREDQGGEASLSLSKKSLGREVLLSPSKKSPREDRGREISLSPSMKSPRKSLGREVPSPRIKLLPQIVEKKSNLKSIVLTREQVEVHPEEAIKAMQRASKTPESNAIVMEIEPSVSSKSKRTSVGDLEQDWDLPEESAILDQQAKALQNTKSVAGDEAKIAVNIPKEKTDAASVTGVYNIPAVTRTEVSDYNSSSSSNLDTRADDEATAINEGVEDEQVTLVDSLRVGEQKLPSEELEEFPSREQEVPLRFEQQDSYVTQENSLSEIEHEEPLNKDAIHVEEDSENEGDKFVLLPVGLIKPIESRQGDHSGDGSYLGATNTASYQVDVELSDSEESLDDDPNSSKAVHITRSQEKPGGSAATASKPSSSSSVSKTRQMTMKEFIEKLAQKPVQLSPAVKPGEKPRPRLVDLLKTHHRTVSTQKTPSQTVTAKKIREKIRKPLPSCLAKGITKEIFTHFAKCGLTADGMKDVMNISGKYWKNLSTDLVNISTVKNTSGVIEARYMRMLLSRQKFITTNMSLFALVEEYLPVEQWNTIIPTRYAKDNIYPSETVVDKIFK